MKNVHNKYVYAQEQVDLESLGGNCGGRSAEKMQEKELFL